MLSKIDEPLLRRIIRALQVSGGESTAEDLAYLAKFGKTYPTPRKVISVLQGSGRSDIQIQTGKTSSKTVITLTGYNPVDAAKQYFAWMEEHGLEEPSSVYAEIAQRVFNMHSPEDIVKMPLEDLVAETTQYMLDNSARRRACIHVIPAIMLYCRELQK